MPIYTWDVDALSGRQTVEVNNEVIPTYERKIRTVCAWCPPDKKAVIVDIPEDGRGVSHGMCFACRRQYLACRDQARS